MSMSHCFILPLIVQLRQLRDRCCKMMLLSEGFGMASEEKSDSPLFHSFGFAVSPSEMDLKKETMSGVQIFQLLCRVAVLHIEIVVNSWCFSVHMSMQIFERWPQLQWVSEIPFTDLWCGFDSVQRLLLLSNWNAYPYLSITRKLFVAGNECGHRRKCCLHIFCARVLKCIALRQKPCESDCSLPLGWDLPKVWAYTNTLQKCFHLPAAHKVCVLPSEKPLPLQLFAAFSRNQVQQCPPQAPTLHLSKAVSAPELPKCHQWNSAQHWSPALSDQWPKTIAIDFPWECIGELKWPCSPW